MNWRALEVGELVAIGTAATAVVATVVRWGIRHHRSYILLSDHVKDEEERVWPDVQQSLSALSETVTENHEETLRLLGAHGERLARVEAKMPNGELAEIRRLVEQLVQR